MTTTAEEIIGGINPYWASSLLALEAPSFSDEQLEAAMRSFDAMLKVERITFDYHQRIGRNATTFVVDGISFGYYHNSAPAHHLILEQRLPSVYVANPQQQFGHHSNYICVFAPNNPPEAMRVRAAQLLTLMSAAVMRLCKVIAVKWEDGKNILPSEAFWDGCGTSLSERGLAMPLWLRVTTQRGELPEKPGSGPLQLVGTYGLPLFGHRDLEVFLKRGTAEFGTMLCYSLGDRLLRNEPGPAEGDTVTFENTIFKCRHLIAGRLSGWPVLELWEQ